MKVNALESKKLHHLTVRVLAFFIFATLLYGIEYRQVQNEGFVFDPNTQARLMGTIRGANGGYPFYFYLGEGIDPGTIDPNYAYQWSNTADDYGVHIMVASLSVIVRQFDSDYLVNTSTPFKALFALFLFTAFVFLWPIVPLPISLSGILALSVGIFLGPIALNTSAQGWGVTYMALLAGMGIATSTLPKKTFFEFVFFVLLGSLLGFAQFLRQESVGTAYASGIGLLITSWFIAAIAYFVQRDDWRSTMLPIVRRVSLSAVILIFAVLLVPLVVRGMYARAWNIPYSETVLTRHGAGLPLYVGTGYVSNPYNIAWLDPIGEIHAQLYNPGVNISHGNADFQATLQSAWRDIAVESPWLIIKNVIAKLQFAESFLRNGKTPYPSAFLYTEQSDAMRAIYFLAILIYIGTVMFTLYTKRLDSLFLLMAFSALAIGSCVGPLSGFPSYIAGPQGATLVFVFLLPAAHLYHEPLWTILSPRIFNRVISVGIGLIGLLFLLGGVGIFFQWQTYQNRIEKIKTADPITEIQTQEFKYGHYFNELSTDEQESIIENLRISEGVLTPAASEPQTDFFKPIVTVLSKNQLHLIVWLGDNYPEPANYINQARVYSLVQICLDCATLTQTYNYTHDSVVYTFLNDSDWKNEYRFLSFPIDSVAFAQAEHLLIGVQQIVNWGGTATGFSYQVKDLANEILK